MGVLLDHVPGVAAASYALLVMNILYINQFPDRKADEAVGKHHWVVRLGLQAAPLGYAVIGAAAYIWLVGAVIAGWLPKPALAALVTAAMTFGAAKQLFAYAGTPAQLERYLPSVIRGDLITAVAVTEPDAGSDVKSIRTRAHRDGDDWVLNGSKMFITNGVHADLYFVAARTDPDTRGSRALSMFIIEKDTPGLRVGRALKKTGWLCSDTAELSYDDVRVPAENLVGEENQGFYYVMQQFVTERLGLATQAYATAQRCLDLSVEYARQRETFGKPLISRQVIRHKLTEMHQRTDAARKVTRLAVERALETDRTDMSLILDAVLAKNTAVKTVEWVANEAVQIHGGMGYMRELWIERAYRDARITRIYEGTSEVQRMVIASGLLENS